LTKHARTLLKGALSRTLSADPAQLAAARRELEQATTRFRQLARVLVPLGEEGITVDKARNILTEWRSTLTARSGSIVGQLALRLAILAASIGVIVAVSAIWRRATFRYLHDARRRRQFLALRRVVTGVAMTLVILMAVLSEVGSVATYVGFLTAGLAVALQNVILAVVGYFFLIGRYGVRVGDRVTLAGVTGRVVDIGLLRIYLIELAGPGLHTTGRMIVLSNAVLFQPSALFKQIPGADYVWHTVTLTLAPTADLRLAQSRLRSAVNSVHEKYRSSIDSQFAAAQRLVDFESSPPRPEIDIRFTEMGLEFSIRYPVEPERAADVDQEMVQALRKALDEPPPLPLAAAGAPALNSSTG
jgi:small-conductance mechanosensitive channel